MLALLGRFFQRCIRAAEAGRQGIQVDEFEPDIMTDAEISDFLKGRRVDWAIVRARKAGVEAAVRFGDRLVVRQHRRVPQ